MQSGQFNLAQITDMHLRTDDGGAAAAQLKRALDGARAYRADAIILTGDLVNDARAGEYELLAEALQSPPAPLFLLPGNHDDRALVRAAFADHDYLPRSGALSFAVEDFPIRIVALDQVEPGETYGVMGAAGADWLQHTLAAAPDRPTLVALHHPPFLTHDRLFDGIGLRDADRFAAIIARHRQVMRIVCGHHHRLVLGQVAHAPVVVAPSTSWAYGLAQHEGQNIAPRTSEQPGWMLHSWREGGGMASHFMGL